MSDAGGCRRMYAPTRRTTSGGPTAKVNRPRVRTCSFQASAVKPCRASTPSTADNDRPSASHASARDWSDTWGNAPSNPSASLRSKKVTSVDAERSDCTGTEYVCADEGPPPPGRALPADARRAHPDRTWSATSGTSPRSPPAGNTTGSSTCAGSSGKPPSPNATRHDRHDHRQDPHPAGRHRRPAEPGRLTRPTRQQLWQEITYCVPGPDAAGLAARAQDRRGHRRGSHRSRRRTDHRRHHPLLRHLHLRPDHI
jgi:hypothetical protein